MYVTMNKVVSDGSAPLILQRSDVIIGSHQYCSKQPGNIHLNNIVLDRRGGYKSINSYNRGCKTDYVCKIVLEIELLGGRFLVRNGSDHFSLATDELKKETVQRRLLRKANGSKRVISGGGLGECPNIDEDKLVLSSRGGTEVRGGFVG